MERYLYYFLVIAVFVLSLLAQSHVQRVFQNYAQQHTRSGIPAARLAQELLLRNGLSLPVQRVSGSLTDHYDPRSEVVGLSEAVYDSDSVSAFAVAAHEIGHVLQHQEDYGPMRVRSVLLPVANIGCRFGPLLVIGGLLLCYLFGTIWFSVLNADRGFAASLMICVVPFLLPDAAKLALALVIGRKLRKQLGHS